MLIGCLELASSSLDDGTGKIQKNEPKSDVNSRLKNDPITDIDFSEISVKRRNVFQKCNDIFQDYMLWNEFQIFHHVLPSLSCTIFSYSSNLSMKNFLIIASCYIRN